MKNNNLVPKSILAVYAVLFIACAINPYDRVVWVAEIAPMILIVLAVAIVSKYYYRFSNTSYILMAFLVYLHTIGSHYTFERVPFGLVTELFGFSRNHFDRMAHFTVGFYAYPIIELALEKRLINGRKTAVAFGIFAIMTVAAAYEIIEWIFAIMAEPDAGIAVLGSQGDIWDAQKDMLADGLGAITAAVMYLLTSYSSTSR